MIMVPLREEVDVFSAVVTETTRLPVPLVGERETQDRFSDVVHGQLLEDAVTVSELLPPESGKF